MSAGTWVTAEVATAGPEASARLHGSHRDQVSCGSVTRASRFLTGLAESLGIGLAGAGGEEPKSLHARMLAAHAERAAAGGGGQPRPRPRRPASLRSSRWKRLVQVRS